MYIYMVKNAIQVHGLYVEGSKGTVCMQRVLHFERYVRAAHLEHGEERGLEIHEPGAAGAEEVRGQNSKDDGEHEEEEEGVEQGKDGVSNRHDDFVQVVEERACPLRTRAV